MDGGQHGPPRREVWSYHHPSSKIIRHLFKQASGESLVLISLRLIRGFTATI